METHRVSGLVAGAGFLVLIFCAGWSLYWLHYSDDIASASTKSCKAEFDKTTDWKTATNTPAIQAVWPTKTAFSRTICMVVSGVVSPETQAKLEKESAEPQSITLYPFLNNLRADHLKQGAKAIATPQTIMITLEAQEDASKEAARYWRSLLHSGSDFSEKKITIGFARTQTDTPEVNLGDATTLVVYDKWSELWAGLALFLLVLALILYARNSSLLRDDNCVWKKDDINKMIETKTQERDKVVAGETPEAAKSRVDAANAEIAALQGDLNRFPADKASVKTLRCTFSLAKSQMAFWLVLSTAGFLYIWLTTGQYYNLITGGVLVLLGISGTTGLAAIQLSNEKVAKRPSVGFWTDILSDPDGPALYRVQALGWTIILGAIFVWNVMYDFRFSEFDTNLLIMIGISQSLYLGFKAKDSLAK